MPLPLLSMTVALALLAVSWFAWERARYASARRERRLHYRRWVQEAPGLSTQPRQDAIPLDRMNPQRALQIRLDAEAAARRAWTAGAGEPANPHPRHTAAAVLWTATYHLTWLTLAEDSVRVAVPAR